MNRLEGLTADDLRSLADALDGVPRLVVRASSHHDEVWIDRTVNVEMDRDALRAWTSSPASAPIS